MVIGRGIRQPWLCGVVRALVRRPLVAAPGGGPEARSHSAVVHSGAGAQVF
jgi:hypothetical protein